MTEAENTNLIPSGVDFVKLYADQDALQVVLGQIETFAKTEAFDIDTEAGRTAAKSMAYKVARSKTFLLDKGKEQKADAEKVIKAINSTAKVIEAHLDKVRDEVKAPALEWEAKEESRKDALKAAFAELQVSDSWAAMDLTALQAKRQSITSAEINAAWAEYQTEAEIAKGAALSWLEGRIEQEMQAEAERKELEELRAFKAQKQAEEDARLAAAAADEQAKKDEEARQQREQEAEARRAEEAKRAEEDAQRRIEEAKAQAERDAQDKIDAERRRVEKEAADKAAEEDRRAANQRIRNAAGKAIMQSLMAEVEGMTDDLARATATAMLNGKVARVKVEF